MAHPGRFERPTYGSVVRCSIQLSYGCAKNYLRTANSRESVSNMQLSAGTEAGQRSGAEARLYRFRIMLWSST